MSKKLNSFQELREIKDDGPSAQERFNKLVKGNMGRISSGNFSSKLKYVNSITIVTPRSEEDKEPNQLNITMFHGGNAQEQKATLTLTDEGELIGSVPEITLSKEPKRVLSKEILLEEVLDIIEAANPKFFTSVDDDILPPGDEPLVEDGGTEGNKESSDADKTEKIADPRRLSIVTEMDKALFGFVGANSGFNGYYGVVFPHCLVLENPKIGNAAYIVRFEDKIEVDPDKLEKEPPERFPDENRREEVLNDRWEPFAGLTKEEMQRLANATRVIHPPHNREDYRDFVRKAIKDAAQDIEMDTREVARNADVSGDGAPQTLEGENFENTPDW